MRNRRAGLAVMGLLAALTGLLGACTSLRRDTGDELVERLRVGMTDKEVLAAIGKPESVLHVQNERDLYWLYTAHDRFPYDILSSVEVGSVHWRYSYWVTAHTAASLYLFFDEKLDRLQGWAKQHSQYSRDKFMHEKLTSRLKADRQSRWGGMSHRQVHALIGPPTEIVEFPKRESRSIYENHFWETAPFPSPGTIKQMEVYTYRLDSGASRRVYLVYTPFADKLDFWGYDHAWEEAERYLRERAKK